MAAEEGNKNDFYGVLGLKKECTTAELRSAYKKLAMKWHPDSCSSSGNLKHEEEAKKKFQAIQQAYSVLSDANKRFLYDVGIYDLDDDDENEMGDFLNEMVTIMGQNKSNENTNESFEEFQQLFEEIFDSDNMEIFGSSSRSVTPSTPLSSQDFCNETYSILNKRSSANLNVGAIGFCVGSIGASTEKGYRKNPRDSVRDGRKQKVSCIQRVLHRICVDVLHIARMVEDALP